MVNYLPLSFIILWSSAFVSGQFIVQSASPFAALSFRFLIVAICFLLFSFLIKEKILVNFKLFIQLSITGILFHGFYLGGVFYSYSLGLSATLSALIVGLHSLNKYFKRSYFKRKSYNYSMGGNHIWSEWYNSCYWV